MSDKWQGNKRGYMEWVRDYARHFIGCPECGAEPTKYCLGIFGRGVKPKDFVHRERWKLAYAELRNPELKRDWPRKPAEPKPVRPKSASYTRADFTGKYAARKLREALADDGVIMRKAGDRYVMVVDGMIRGPMTLGAAIEWAFNYGFAEAAQKFRGRAGLAA